MARPLHRAHRPLLKTPQSLSWRSSPRTFSLQWVTASFRPLLPVPTGLSGLDPWGLTASVTCPTRPSWSSVFLAGSAAINHFWWLLPNTSPGKGCKERLVSLSSFGETEAQKGSNPVTPRGGSVDTGDLGLCVLALGGWGACDAFPERICQEGKKANKLSILVCTLFPCQERTGLNI